MSECNNNCWDHVQYGSVIVRSLRLPSDDQRKNKESLGRMRFKKSVSQAAALYRTIKHLPDDWPLEAEMLNADGEVVGRRILPRTDDLTDQPETSEQPADTSAEASDTSEAQKEASDNVEEASE